MQCFDALVWKPENQIFNRRPKNINFQSHHGCTRLKCVEWKPCFPFCIFRFCISVFLFSSEVECPINGLLMFSSPITAGKELHQIPSEILNSHIMLFLNLFAAHTVSQMCFLSSSIDLLQLQQSQKHFAANSRVIIVCDESNYEVMIVCEYALKAQLQAGNFPTLLKQQVV